ncbi:cysteine hydrolase family protein [Paractinoplanes atraurantiacus]|uniref:Nicotinamidase-related amidase n=1 Tax=Paractinoplanes atraurantiacus TaxID=1036182 RepID=A0A285K8U3_9ACTN|nr:cysteine hydrolase [Actinoplanes atraurantiacus]SNY69034.1 Nicotinamidase-related amidase [Actinoplanes atraurantiacus]
MSELRTAQLAALRGRKPALIVVDVQRSFADSPVVADAVAAIGKLVQVARTAGVTVAWVELGSDPRHPWHASQWLRAGDPEAPYGPEEPCVLGTSGAEWYGTEPAEGEIRVVKRGYSGFLGTSLESQLRAAGIEWVAVCGLTTECCVAATATDAFQLDWPVLLPVNGVAAYDKELHESALASLALNAAVLTDSDELADLWVTA